MTGRRRSRRYELQLPAQVCVASQSAESGKLCDLSAGGAMILSPLEAESGVRVQVRFLIDPELHCEAQGHVLRTVPFGALYGIAFEFSQFNDPFRHFLSNLDRAVADERARFLDDVRDLRVELLTS